MCPFQSLQRTVEGTAHIAITKPGVPFIITTDDQVGYLAMVVPLRRDGAR